MNTVKTQLAGEGARSDHIGEMFPHEPPLDRLLTIRELLTYLPVCRETLWRWTREGKFPPPRKIAGRNLWRAGEIERFIAGGETVRPDDPRLLPRLLNRDSAAAYLACSTDTIDRLLATGAIAVIRLPAARHRTGAAVADRCRRVLIDRLELDSLVDAWREPPEVPR